MSETQESIVHTPGPWEAILYDGGAFDVVNHDSPNHNCILAARNSYEARAGEMHANARLIAAAPELLSALQGALRIADLWRPCGDWPEKHWEEAKALNLMFSQFEEITRKVV